ncbi:MAG TPA: hypothetical protein VGF90_05435, partial [Verrucomicrobiae bacterium]
GLLAVEIAATMQNQNLKNIIGGVLFVVALVFVHRSFYGMRVPEAKEETLTTPDCQVPERSNNSHLASPELTLNHGKSNGESSIVLEEGQTLAARRN